METMLQVSNLNIMINIVKLFLKEKLHKIVIILLKISSTSHLLLGKTKKVANFLFQEPFIKFKMFTIKFKEVTKIVIFLKNINTKKYLYDLVIF